MLGDDELGDDELGGAQGKRVGPEDVAPVIIGKLRFEAIHWGRERGLGQNGGYIAAYDVDTGDEQWLLKLYDIQYDPDMEEDVQDLFIESMSPSKSGQKLKVVDEDGRRYLVDPQQRSVEKR